MSTLHSVGSFRLALPDHTWTWSFGVFAVYGLQAAHDVPTTELVLDHQHPDDRSSFNQFLDNVTTIGRPAAVWHRVVGGDGAVRQVVTTAIGVSDWGRKLDLVTGQVADVTEAVRLATSRDVDDALEQLSRSRPVIDQAKGALMLTYAIDEETAFDLLREYSQHLNVKVRDLARELVDDAQQPGGWSPGTRNLLDGLMVGLRDPASGANPGA
jgi:hypothetical protein